MREDGWRPWSPGQAIASAGAGAGDRASRGRGRAPENTLAGLRSRARAGRPLGRVRRHAQPGRGAGPDPRRDPAAHDRWPRPGAAAHRGRNPCAAMPAAGSRRSSPASGCRPWRRRWPCCSSWACTRTSRSSRRAGRELRTGEVVADALRRLWPEDGPRLLLSSFEREALAPARSPRRTYRAACSPSSLPDDWADADAGARLHHAASGPQSGWAWRRCARLTADGRAGAALYRQQPSRAPASCSPPAPRRCSPIVPDRAARRWPQ